MSKYNRLNVYNNAVKNTKIFQLIFTSAELKLISDSLTFNMLYSKMYRHIAQNLNYNFSISLKTINLNSYQIDGLKDCIENYINKAKHLTSYEIKYLTQIKNGLIKLIVKD